jgi:hypothetical protein
MSNGSGKTPEQFVTDWLSLWLNSYAVNSDTVPARTQMFSQVIQPWAAASGVTATLFTNPFTGFRTVILSGPLNLNIAPYRLEAIVNRIDLGETSTGGGGLYGSVTGSPTTAGELRFIFGVVQPNPWGGGSEATCGRKLFTTIFEYGVPRTGCSSVVDWARQWTGLQAMPGFTPAYLAQLQSMTESVVLHGSAPAKGNQNAINQIRTNEFLVGNQPPDAAWESAVGGSAGGQSGQHVLGPVGRGVVDRGDRVPADPADRGPAAGHRRGVLLRGGRHGYRPIPVPGGDLRDPGGRGRASPDLIEMRDRPGVFEKSRIGWGPFSWSRPMAGPGPPWPDLSDPVVPDRGAPWHSRQTTAARIRCGQIRAASTA